MVIKLLTIDLHFPGRSSLKEKRFVLSSVKTKLARQFNVSIAEIDYHDKWQRSKLAVVTVASDGVVAQSTCDKLLEKLENDHRLSVLDSEQQVL